MLDGEAEQYSKVPAETAKPEKKSTAKKSVDKTPTAKKNSDTKSANKKSTS